MPGYLHDDVLDDGLQTITDNAERLVITSSLPANYAAVAAVTLGEKANPTVGAPENGASNGRRVRVSSFTDGEVTATGTATHWCLVDDTTDRLLAAQTLTSQVVTDGNPFSLPELSVTIPDPA
jgi:hypothetical protein